MTNPTLPVEPAERPVFAPYSEATVDNEPDEMDDLDDDFAPHARKRLGKPTIALAGLVLIGAGVLGGIQINKHQGTTSTAAGGFANRAGAGGATLPEGLAGGFGSRNGAGGTGAGGTGTGTGTGTGAGGTGTGTGTGTGATTATPVVVGSVVSTSASSVVVKNLGGTSVTVKITATTTVTKVLGSPDLAAGTNVTVFGTTAADGSVTATNITVRA